MNFSGNVGSEQGFLPQMPIGQWGILPAVCCLGGDLGILFILLLILLQVCVLFFLHLSSSIGNSIN